MMKMATLGDWLRAVFTVAMIALAAYWLWVVAGYLSAPTVKDAQNNVIDPYTRSKDILLIVLPLLTTVFGYWFGQQGKEAAEEKAETTKQQLNSVLVESDSDMAARVRTTHPEIFGPTSPPVSK